MSETTSTTFEQALDSWHVKYPTAAISLQAIVREYVTTTKKVSYRRVGRAVAELQFELPWELQPGLPLDPV